YRQPMLLFRNSSDGRFRDIAAAAGLDQVPLASRRGAAFGDVNNDGMINILVFNVGQAPSLFLQESKNGNHTVLFKLIGTKSNRAAIGARIRVRTGSVAQMQEVRGGASYLSQNDLRLHFGLGTTQTMDAVEIFWPSGKTEVLRNVAADAIYTVTEGQGITAKAAFSAP
ncbi:MAG TPA: CRTAC1 family protein, partial [Terriglobales bacterium]|nr:CRTAC1 family protein [Terriglobales bacterium]